MLYTARKKIYLKRSHPLYTLIMTNVHLDIHRRRRRRHISRRHHRRYRISRRPRRRCSSSRRRCRHCHCHRRYRHPPSSLSSS